MGNSRRILASGDPETPAGVGAGELDDLVRQASEGFRVNAPLSASEAATIILDAVQDDAWRILVGDDARMLDEAVRSDPLAVYGPDGLSLRSIWSG
jgi:hypothetical protein